MGNTDKPTKSKIDADETIVTDSFKSVAGPVHVVWRQDDEEQRRTFTESFTIGRDSTCDVSIADSGVSRLHVRISPVGGQWCVEDLDSGNGTFLDSVRIREAVLPMTCSLQLGDEYKLWLNAPDAASSITDEEIAEKYFGDSAEHELGDKTLRVRAEYLRLDKKQKRHNRKAATA